MTRLTFDVTYAAPDGGQLGAGGTQTLSLRDQQAFLLAPTTIDAAHAYPLVTLLHGAGRQDEIIARSLEGEADRRQALFLVPRSWQMTWDLIAGGDGEDLGFLSHCVDAIYRRYPIDPARQALIGYSDGASYALALGLSNPRVFAAVMAWAAGFLAIDAENLRPGDPKPRIFLEYGTRDQLFPFDRVALPMKEALERLGYPLTFRADEGGIHWPSARFQADALDWFLGAG